MLEIPWAMDHSNVDLWCQSMQDLILSIHLSSKHRTNLKSTCKKGEKESQVSMSLSTLKQIQ